MGINSTSFIIILKWPKKEARKTPKRPNSIKFSVKDIVIHLLKTIEQQQLSSVISSKTFMDYE